VEDLYLFRGVAHFYSRNYKEAIGDFEQVRQKGEKTRELMSSLNATFKSALSERTDLSDIGLTSLNTFEQTYNILVCHLLMKQEE
jgi:hypothetical protein